MFKITSNCLNCGICVHECPEGAMSEKLGKIVIDKDKCSECGLCEELCLIEGVVYVDED